MTLDPSVSPWLAGLAVAGVIAGLWLLVRGMGSYRTATRVADTGTSTIASMAAGEVRIAGVIEPAEITLVSPLQSEPCVYYRSIVRDDDDASDLEADFREERAVGFQVRDATGTIRVFPRGAHWDAPTRFDEHGGGSFAGAPPGLRVRTGSPYALAEPDRDVAIAELLAIRPASSASSEPLLRLSTPDRKKTYEEARLGPGDTVTIVGRAMPFADLADPAEADVALASDLAIDDPEVLGDIAEARHVGLLATDPATAWGNAAIPGFGIGRPVRAPSLDPSADRPALASPEDAARFERTFHIPPEALVLASAPGVPLLVAHGVPGSVVDRGQDRFLVGLLGAVLAIASVVGLAIVVRGGLGS